MKDGNRINLQLWDTAGSEKYHSLMRNYIRNAQGCLLVFDLTDENSFNNIEIWRNEFLNALNPRDGEKFPFILVGNKLDLNNMIKVNEFQIKNYCDKHNNMPYFLCSAYTGKNVNLLFEKIADLSLQRYRKFDDFNDGLIPGTIDLKNKKEPEKKCCF